MAKQMVSVTRTPMVADLGLIMLEDKQEMKCIGDPLKSYLWCCGRMSLVLVCWMKVELKLLNSPDGLLHFPVG